MIEFTEDIETTWLDLPIDVEEDSTVWVLLRDGKTAVKVHTEDGGFFPVDHINHPVSGEDPIIRFEDVISWNRTGWIEPPTPSGRMFETSRMLLKAVRFATQAHEGQVRKFQDVPYIVHPTAVATYIEILGGTTTERITALLHDTVEDTDVTIEQIVEQFGFEVAQLVAELTIDKSDPAYEGNDGKRDYLIAKMLHMSEPALFIKLVDRLDNVCDLKAVTDTTFLDRYVNETNAILTGIMYKREHTPRTEAVMGAIRRVVDDASHFSYMSRVYKANA